MSKIPPILERPLPVAGFRFGSIAAGIKKRGGLDLGVILSEEPVSAAGVFTRNLVKAAPVLLASERVRRGQARAVLVNSGNANACTGAPGMKAATLTTGALAKALGIDAAEVLPCSTGVIGAQLPVDKITAAIPALLRSADADGGEGFSRAIMTTDQWPKVASVDVGRGSKATRVVAFAKGAGMIHPNMATTLAFVVTDARVRPALLHKLLREACDATFNCISVDGDTSTNDTILALASGRGAEARAGSPEAKALALAMTTALDHVAKSIVRDGEGAEHAVRIEVQGLATADQARRVAQTVATSPLVKTAIHGRDANWGRILAAAGRAGVRFDPNAASIHIGDAEVVRRGLPTGAEAEARASAVMKDVEYTIRVKLGAGKGRAHFVTSDLGHGYIDVNASYRS